MIVKDPEYCRRSRSKLLGSYLDCSPELVEAALASQLSVAVQRKRIGEALVDGRLISPEALARGLQAQRIDRLRQCPLFADFDRAQLARVAEVFHELTASGGVTLIKQGQLDQHLYVLGSGRLEIWRETTDGERIELGVAGPGEPVGEIAYASGALRTASVRTVGRCELLVATFKSLRVLLNELPELSHALMNVITRRLLNITSRFEDQSRQLLKVERSFDQFNAFRGVSGAGGPDEGLERLLKRLVSTASDLTDAQRGAVFLRDKDTGELWSWVERDGRLQEVRVAGNAGVAGWVATQRELVNVADASVDERFALADECGVGHGSRTILCTPIWGSIGDIIGVVQVVNKSVGVFSDADETLIRAFAHEAAIALENFDLHSRLIERHRQVGVLLELTTAITQTLNLQTLLERVAVHMSQALQCERCSFWVMDHVTGELWSMDDSGGEGLTVRIAADKGLVGYAATHGESIRVDDAYRDERFNAEVDRISGYRTRDVICTPIVNREGRVIGVTQCIGKLAGLFDEADANLAEGIASHIAIALENSQMHARAVEMQSYLENVQGSIASGIISLDEGGRIVTANKAAEALLPCVLALGDQRSLERVVGPANAELIALVDDAYSRGARVTRQDLTLQDPGPGAAAHTVNAEVLPLHDGKGSFKGLVVMLEDVTTERRIKKAFEQCVAPAVVEQLLANPECLRLHGEKRTVTAMFTNIEGFAAMSELIEPGELVRLLAEYFDGARDIVLKHGGTIDKIVGDSLRVLFNAPAEQPDHAERAVRCALELAAFCAGPNNGQSGEQSRLGRTRIGINTGECVVGNFAGAARFDYTAYGDAINTAARLEGANKHLGTRICVSDETRRRCKDIAFRPVGELVLKAERDAVGVFEPVPRERAASAAYRAYLASYAALEEDPAMAGERFEALLELDANDGLTKFYAERMARGIQGSRIVLAEA